MKNKQIYIRPLTIKLEREKKKRNQRKRNNVTKNEIKKVASHLTKCAPGNFFKLTVSNFSNFFHALHCYVFHNRYSIKTFSTAMFLMPPQVLMCFFPNLGDKEKRGIKTVALLARKHIDHRRNFRSNPRRERVSCNF